MSQTQRTESVGGNMKREDVYKLIDGEREYQDLKWEDHNSNKFHEPEAWIMYMEHYLDRAKALLSTEHVDSAYPLAMGHIRKVAALDVVCMENYDTPPRTYIKVTT